MSLTEPGAPAEPGASAGRRRGRWVRRVTVAVASLTAVAVLAVSGAGYALLTYSENRLRRVDVFNGLTGRPSNAPTQAQTYLVVGSDKREGLTPEQARRLGVGRATAANAPGSGPTRCC